jgi:hypothetical protein
VSGQPSLLSRLAGIDVLMQRIDGFERRANERLDRQDRVAEQTLDQAKRTNGRITAAEHKLEEIDRRHLAEDEARKRESERVFSWRQALTLAIISSVLTFVMYEVLSSHPFH